MIAREVPTFGGPVRLCTQQGPRPRQSMDRRRWTSTTEGDPCTVAQSDAASCWASSCRSRSPGRPPRRTRGSSTAARRPVLAEQAERAGGRDRRQLIRTSSSPGANDEIDMEACNAGHRQHVPVHAGVGVSGVYFSFDSGDDLDPADVHRPDSARDCLGVVGDSDPACSAAHRRRSARCRGTPRTGSSPTATRRSPSVRARGRGGLQLDQRLAALLREPDLERRGHAHRADVQGLRGDRRLAHRRPPPAAAARRGKGAWMPPVIVSRQSSTTFSDKEQVWADNASSSPFFGNVYVCWASFRGQEKGNARRHRSRSRRNDGGSWTQHQITPAANNMPAQPGRTGARSAPTATARRTCSASQFGSAPRLSGGRRS